MLEGVNSILKDFWTLRVEDEIFGLLREKKRIGQPSQGFRERSNTLIYSGSITSDLHPLP